LTGAETVTLLAPTPPDTVVPVAVTHDPTVTSVAVAGTVWVIVAPLPRVTRTFLVEVLGLAFFFLGGVKVVDLTVIVFPEIDTTGPDATPKLAGPVRVPPLPPFGNEPEGRCPLPNRRVP
jgi:hypothetical protein